MKALEKKLSLEERLSVDNFEVDEVPHIKVDTKMCVRCDLKPCLYICPAGLYTLENEEIHFNYEGCLECGSCRVVCPLEAVDWNYPRGGFGVNYQYG